MKNYKLITAIIITFFTLIPIITQAGGYVSNKSYCLSIDSSKANTVGDMAFMENSCGSRLTVKYCFGSYNCESSKAQTTVPPYDKKTIFFDKDEYNSMSLISFACDEDVDRQDCWEAAKEFFKYK